MQIVYLFFNYKTLNLHCLLKYIVPCLMIVDHFFDKCGFIQVGRLGKVCNPLVSQVTW